MKSAGLKKMIKIRSVELGVPLAQIAKELGVSRQFVYQVCAGRRPTARIREHICRRLGLEPAQLGWSENDMSPALFKKHLRSGFLVYTHHGRAVSGSPWPDGARQF
jgi:transcriptional regulator with XRE-family HTH domain